MGGSKIRGLNARVLFSFASLQNLEQQYWTFATALFARENVRRLPWPLVSRNGWLEGSETEKPTSGLCFGA